MIQLHILYPGTTKIADEILVSNLASARLRLGPLVHAAKKSGWALTIGDIIPNSATHVVVGKIGATDIRNREVQWLNQISIASAWGAQIFVDYTDHHLETGSVMTPFYESLSSFDCNFVVPNAALAEVLWSQCKSLTLHVIDDWMEYQPISPKTSPSKTTRILWFGHSSNAQFLAELLTIWPTISKPTELMVVSSAQTLEVLRQYSFKDQPNVGVKFIPWSVDSVPRIAKLCDCAVIPSDLNSPKRFASNNRLVTALMLGLPTVATPLPSYREFEEFFTVLNVETLSSMLNAPEQKAASVRVFQARYADRFRLGTLSNQWQNLMT